MTKKEIFFTLSAHASLHASRDILCVSLVSDSLHAPARPSPVRWQRLQWLKVCNPPGASVRQFAAYHIKRVTAKCICYRMFTTLIVDSNDLYNVSQ
jgi:hypothetical protein